MRPGILAAFCAMSILLPGCASNLVPPSEERTYKIEARAAAIHWLELLDQGDYEEAFEFEAQDFRMNRTQSQFVRLMQARRAPFGKAIGRKFIGAAHIQKFVGAPDGIYETVLFKTNFEHKNPTAERVILIDQADGWRVIDYRIY